MLSSLERGYSKSILSGTGLILPLWSVTILSSLERDYLNLSGTGLCGSLWNRTALSSLERFLGIEG